jgi:hypothetical protein
VVDVILLSRFWSFGRLSIASMMDVTHSRREVRLAALTFTEFAQRFSTEGSMAEIMGQVVDGKCSDFGSFDVLEMGEVFSLWPAARKLLCRRCRKSNATKSHSQQGIAGAKAKAPQTQYHRQTRQQEFEIL